MIKKVNLIDYKVRIIPNKKGTESAIRVLIDFKLNATENFSCIGVSKNIIEASLIALYDAYSYVIFIDKGPCK